MAKIKPEIKVLLKLAVERRKTCNDCEHKINDKEYYVICGVPDCDCKKRINYVHGKCPKEKWPDKLAQLIQSIQKKDNKESN